MPSAAPLEGQDPSHRAGQTLCGDHLPHPPEPLDSGKCPQPRKAPTFVSRWPWVLLSARATWSHCDLETQYMLSGQNNTWQMAIH